jgi:hypothetical protein
MINLKYLSIYYVSSCFLALVIVTVVSNNNEQLGNLVSKRQSSFICNSDSECGNGVCQLKSTDVETNSCICNRYYTSSNGQPCNYKQKGKLETFLISFFVGILGIDWFFLSDGTALYIGLGILKFFTIGGCGAWSIVDWIRVLADAFPDGNGYPLYQNM